MRKPGKTAEPSLPQLMTCHPAMVHAILPTTRPDRSAGAAGGAERGDGKRSFSCSARRGLRRMAGKG
ncbi:hypothetical protein ACTDI4_03390 [Mesorhizobium sp. PUT5]|uniref:hypothetical protein n=1 Tax=Mesorhizobium sp. PUT5 TaxID=3454629 RepID=UPI003FA481E9